MIHNKKNILQIPIPFALLLFIKLRFRKLEI